MKIFAARKRAMNYYFRKPPTTNPRIAHGVKRLRLARNDFKTLPNDMGTYLKQVRVNVEMGWRGVGWGVLG